MELLITLINVSTNLAVTAPQTWAHVAGVIHAAASTGALSICLCLVSREGFSLMSKWEEPVLSWADRSFLGKLLILFLAVSFWIKHQHTGRQVRNMLGEQLAEAYISLVASQQWASPGLNFSTSSLQHFYK